MGILLTTSIALLAGLLMTRAFKPFKLPAVTAYLIAGVLIGPYCLGRCGIENLGFNSMHAVELLSLVSEVALGFIAFSIGSEFRLNDLKKTGNVIAVQLYQSDLDSSDVFFRLKSLTVSYTTTAPFATSEGVQVTMHNLKDIKDIHLSMTGENVSEEDTGIIYLSDVTEGCDYLQNEE